MSNASTLIVLGILGIILPFSGLPVAIRSFLTVVFGAWIIGIGFSLRKQSVKEVQPPPPPAPPQSPQAF